MTLYLGRPVADNSDGSWDDIVGRAISGRDGPVSETFRFELRTKRFELQQDITPAVLSASIQLDNSRAVMRTAKFTMDPQALRWQGMPPVSSAITINPLTDFVAPWHRVLTPTDGGTWVDTPLGLYVLDWPQITNTGRVASWSVNGSDLSLIMAQRRRATTFSIIGNDPVAYVPLLLTLAGLRFALPSFGQTIESYIWPAGTTELQIINDAFGLGSLSPLWFDRRAIGRARQIDAFSGRTPDVTYSADDLMVLSPWSESGDLTTVANQVLVITSGSDDPLSSVATNNNPASATSVAQLGRTISRVVSAPAPASQDALDAMALAELQASGSYLRTGKMLTPFDPRREPQEVYRLDVPGVSDGLAWSCTGYSAELRAGAAMQHQISVVQPL